jgi:hypothetical protein
MADQDEPGAPPSAAPPSSGRSEPSDNPTSASDDLADGLDLMFRAAKKAARTVDPANVERLGRRAVESIGHLKREGVAHLGRQAKRKLDPKRVEEIAEEAGKELLRVVERVAERVDAMVNTHGTPPSNEADTGKAGAGKAGAGKADAGGADAGGAGKAEPGEPSPRVRIED